MILNVLVEIKNISLIKIEPHVSILLFLIGNRMILVTVSYSVQCCDVLCCDFLLYGFVPMKKFGIKIVVTCSLKFHSISAIDGVGAD